jgi:hypothetical protein
MPIRAEFLYDLGMPRRRLRRKQQKVQRHALPLLEASARPLARNAPPPDPEPKVVVREAGYVQRLAYTRTQAAAALGVSRSTFDRHVLPLVETVEIWSGSRLIPVDELDRLMAEQRRPARGVAMQRARVGRPAALEAAVVEQIRHRRAEGQSLAQIARELNALGAPTAHGGVRWWPSTVRAVLDRAVG